MYRTMCFAGQATNCQVRDSRIDSQRPVFCINSITSQANFLIYRHCENNNDDDYDLPACSALPQKYVRVTN
jgi:hypothetical protein